MESAQETSFPHSWKAGDSAPIRERIEYHAPYSAADLPFDDNAFDLIYSMAVFEHFDEPNKALEELKRVLSPQGIMVHSIDMAYHYGKALEFLKWTDEEYHKRVGKYGESGGLKDILDGSWEFEAYCNRLRLSDWIEIFEQAGLQILEVIDMAVLDENKIEREQLVEPFRSKSTKDLKVTSAWVIATKNS